MEGIEVLSRQRVLVTGAGGFLGANLCRGLAAKGWEIHGVVRATTDRWRLQDLGPDVVLYPVDLLERERLEALLKSIRPAVIINAAAHSGHPGDEPMATIFGNTVVSLANLLEASADLNLKRFVHLGSSTEYGPKDRPHRESDALRPTTVRGVTKASGTLLALSRGAPVTVLRLFSVFGPWEHRFRLIPAAIRAGLTGAELPLTAPGFRRDFVFVEDVVDACLRAIETDESGGRAFNIGGGREIANEEVVENVSAILGMPVRVRPNSFAPRPTDCPHWCADITEAREVLGWRPGRSFDEGLQATVAWARGFTG